MHVQVTKFYIGIRSEEACPFVINIISGESKGEGESKLGSILSKRFTATVANSSQVRRFNK